MADSTQPNLRAAARFYDKGLRAQAEGDTETAIACFREVLSRDPEDRGGVRLRLAALGAAEVPEQPSAIFVEMLFDENAGAFDERLVRHLGYRVPEALRQAAETRAILPAGTMLDIGCGTGLAGVAFAGATAARRGVDLSAGMLTEASRRGVYQNLHKSDGVGFMRAWAADGRAPFDLVVAADTLPYLGALDGLARAVAAVLRPGGHFLFSTERAEEAAAGERGYAVGAGARYAHAPRYLKRVLSGAGLATVMLSDFVIRTQSELPVPGQIGIARRW